MSSTPSRMRRTLGRPDPLRVRRGGPAWGDPPGRRTVSCVPETDLVIPRVYVAFADPDDASQVFKCDLTWLTSQYMCIFGQGCCGIYADRPDDGCCTLGAYFFVMNDAAPTEKFMKQLTPET